MKQEKRVGIPRSPVVNSHRMIDEYRRLLKKQRVIQRQVDAISYARIMIILRDNRVNPDMCEDEFIEFRNICREIRENSDHVSRRLTHILERVLGDELHVEVDYKILTGDEG